MTSDKFIERGGDTIQWDLQDSTDGTSLIKSSCSLSVGLISWSDLPMGLTEVALQKRIMINKYSTTKGKTYVELDLWDCLLPVFLSALWKCFPMAFFSTAQFPILEFSWGCWKKSDGQSSNQATVKKESQGHSLSHIDVGFQRLSIKFQVHLSP